MRNVVALLAVLLGCSPREQPRAEAGNPPGGAEAQSAPDDSMVLLLPDSAEVWFSGGMPDTAADGTPCYARTLEIRRGGNRTPVPLLYTFGRLEIVDDSTVRAALVRDCAQHDIYLVNTRTAQPRRAP